MAHPSVIDRFTILRPVGTGGMGTVYEAIDPAIDRRVAIKLLHHDVLVQNPEVLERLWIEARAANRIGHAGVVQVSEAGQLADGTGYLVMEFLEGQTLRQRLQQVGGGLPLREALQIATQIASTLNAGHQKGIVHRDLKPDNVMLVPDDAMASGERVKLLDFGIAKIAAPLNQTGAALTVGDMGLGTPGYMAPEQLRDAARATDRTDVYALGAVLFEMLAGQKPYVAPNTAELLVLVMSQDAPPLTTLVPDVAPFLAELIAAMMVRNPANARPPMAAVLRDLLALSGVPSGRRPLSSAEPYSEAGNKSSGFVRTLTPAQVTSSQTPSGFGESAPNAVPPARKVSRRQSVVALGLVACIGLVVTLAIWHPTRGPKPPLVSPPSGTIKPEPDPTTNSQPKTVAPVIGPSEPVKPATVQPIVDKPEPRPDPGIKLVEKPETHPQSPKPPRVARVAVKSDCLPALPVNLRGALASAAASAGLQLAPNQSVTLVRKGAQHFGFASEHVDGISDRVHGDFELILSSKLRSIPIAQNIKRISIRCPAKP